MDELKKDGISVEFSPRDKWMAAGAIVFGGLFVLLLYGKQPGVSIPLFVLAFYTLLLLYERPVVLKREAAFGWFLCIPVVMLSLTYLLFGNDILLLLNLLVLPVLILLQTLLITGANSFKWHSPGILIDLLYGMFYRCFAHMPKPFGILSALVKKNNGSDGTKSNAMKVLTGLLIALPLLLILLLLLASADMVFGRLVEQLTNLFENINLADIVGKLISALTIFFLAFSYLWSTAHKEKMTEGTLNSMPRPLVKNSFWDPITVVTITAAVDVLYITFVVIQFAYLFGGSGLPDGFTYAEYARSGFFELIFVTLLNIGFLSCTLTFTKKGGPAVGLTFRIMNSVMIGCTFVMLYSAHYRMSLYDEAYGYTFLRIMTHAFMAFLLVLFVITLARVWKEELPLLKPYIAVAVVAFVIVNYVNVDNIIVQKNLERYKSVGIIDVSYFRTLSNEAVAQAEGLSGDKNFDVAKEMQDILKERKERLERMKHWQSFNLSDEKARRVLEK